MKKELTMLGFGLLFSLNSLRQSDNIISWKLKLVFGLILMAYSTYLLYINYKKNNVMKFIIPAWLFLIIAGSFIHYSSSATGNKIKINLNPATNFEGITICEEGKIKAKEDIRRSRIRYIFGSFGRDQPLAQNLETKYGIEIIRLEGVLGIPNSCYNQIMYEEIQERYGKNVFEKAFE